MSSSIATPAQFEMSGDVVENWPVFLTQWRRYERTADLRKLPARRHAAIFLAFLGADAWTLLQSRKFDFKQCDVEKMITEVARLCMGETIDDGETTTTAADTHDDNQEQQAGIFPAGPDFMHFGITADTRVDEQLWETANKDRRNRSATIASSKSNSSKSCER